MPSSPFEFARLSSVALLVIAHTAPAQEADNRQPDLAWHDIKELTIEGQGWSDTDAPFDRLPGRAKDAVRATVWRLSHHSAGLVARFSSDATTLHARWTLTSARLALNHMTATGVSGLDLYARDDDGRWRWLAIGRPTLAFGEPSRSHRAQMISELPPGRRDYMLYLPLYNGVESVEIGVPAGSAVDAMPSRTDKPIVFYGTSITQGGCASRPGMVHTAILGRRLERPVINLGFSGNGTMDLPIGHLLAELDAAVYVIDCLPNMTADVVAERVEPLVRVLRAARPLTPILLVEDRSYQNSWLRTSMHTRNLESRAALRRAFDQLSAAGVAHLHYLSGGDLLGDDGEASVDGSHPTDLGFARQAVAFERSLRPLL